MIISTIDLLSINKAAKAIKQKQIIFYNDQIYGLDNLNNYLIHSSYLNTSLPFEETFIFDSRQLSEFVKNITIEGSFNIIDNKILTGNLVELQIITGLYKDLLIDKKNIINLLSNNCTKEEDVTNDLKEMYSMKKVDGVFYYKYKDKYFMTLFPGLLPTLKSDKVRLSIYDNINDNYFIAKYVVLKKDIQISIYLSYLKVA